MFDEFNNTELNDVPIMKEINSLLESTMISVIDDMLELQRDYKLDRVKEEMAVYESLFNFEDDESEEEDVLEGVQESFVDLDYEVTMEGFKPERHEKRLASISEKVEKKLSKIKTQKQKDKLLKYLESNLEMMEMIKSEHPEEKGKGVRTLKSLIVKVKKAKVAVSEAVGEDDNEGKKKNLAEKARQAFAEAKKKLDTFKAKVVEFVNKVINFFKMGCRPMDTFLKNRDYELRQKMAKQPNFAFTMHKWNVVEGDRKFLDCMDMLSKIVKIDYVNRMDGTGEDKKLSFPKACGYNSAMDMYSSLRKTYCSEKKVDQVVKIQDAINLLKNRDKFLQSIKAQGTAVKTLCNQAAALLGAFLADNVMNGEVKAKDISDFYLLIGFINKSMVEGLQLVDVRKSIYFAMYREYGACLRAYLPDKIKLDKKTKAVVPVGNHDNRKDEKEEKNDEEDKSPKSIVPVGESFLDDCMGEIDNF